MGRLCATCVLAILAACAVTPRDNKQFVSAAYSEGAPVVEPVHSVSSFSPALACMDETLLNMHQAPIYISSKVFNDPSGKAGTAVKELVITALGEMSLRSKTFHFIDYEVDLAHQDTVQYLSGLLLGMNAMNIRPPDFYVSGAVSYIDDNVAAKRRSLGISADGSIRGHDASADWAFDGDINTSIIALELHLGEFRTRTLLPGIFAANSAIVAKGGGSQEGGGTIFKTGVQFSLARDYSQGSGLALRSLVDMGMIELVGKWLGLPYWRCLSLEQGAPEFQRELRAWYDHSSQEDLAKLAQKVLQREAYFHGEADGQSSPALKSAITLYQVDHQIPPSGLINFPTYERMIDGFATTDVFGQTRQRTSNEQRDARKQTPTLREGGNGPIDVQLDISRSMPAHVGGGLDLSVQLDRSAALRCFYEDASHVVTQIYPNPYQPVGEVAAHREIRIPSSGAPFSLAFDRTGREAVACYAANPGVFEQLPPEWQSKGLEPIRGTASLAKIRSAMLELSAESVSVGETAFDVTAYAYPPLVAGKP